MADIVFTTHARAAMAERNIKEEWVWRTIESPGRTEEGEDANIHFLKMIPEFDDRILRVVVNKNIQPNRIVTLFFDRRMRRKR